MPIQNHRHHDQDEKKAEKVRHKHLLRALTSLWDLITSAGSCQVTIHKSIFYKVQNPERDFLNRGSWPFYYSLRDINNI